MNEERVDHGVLINFSAQKLYDAFARIFGERLGAEIEVNLRLARESDEKLAGGKTMPVRRSE